MGSAFRATVLLTQTTSIFPGHCSRAPSPKSALRTLAEGPLCTVSPVAPPFCSKPLRAGTHLPAAPSTSQPPPCQARGSRPCPLAAVGSLRPSCGIPSLPQRSRPAAPLPFPPRSILPLCFLSFSLTNERQNIHLSSPFTYYASQVGCKLCGLYLRHQAQCLMHNRGLKSY